MADRKDCPVGMKCHWKGVFTTDDGTEASIDETQREIEAVLTDPSLGTLENVAKVTTSDGKVVGLEGDTRMSGIGNLDTQISADADRGDGTRLLTLVVQMNGTVGEATGGRVEVGDPTP